jgi:putative transposase
MYSSDLRDEEWELINRYFEQGQVFGRPLKHARREIVNAVFYVTKSGCQWRMLPLNFPSWKTVYDYFRRWCIEGTWEKVLDILNRKDRTNRGKAAVPSYGIVDSQSIKTQYNSDDRGIDGGGKVKGRKRHIVTDTEGHLLHTKVHAANIHNTKAAPDVVDRVKEKFPSLKGFSMDGGVQRNNG